MRVGISVITHEGQSIWANGLGQNVFFLARLFRDLPFVSEVVLINCGDQTGFAVDAGPDATAFPLLSQRDATDRVDAVIEMSGALDIEWLDLVRARGVKVAYHICGHPYVGLIEPGLFDTGGYFGRADRCDELWILGQFAPFEAMLQAIHRCPTHLVTPIWAPWFIEKRTAEVAASGLAFGLAETTDFAANGLRVAIFEPNIAVTKTSFIPLLACNEAHKADPTAIAQVAALNTVQFAGHPTFDYFMGALTVNRDGRVKIESRHDFVGLMAQHADAVITHQWCHPSNYLYLDALYGDYPLIHNSEWARDAGYYYPAFDVAAAAAQLLHARAEHQRDLADYRARSRRFLERFDPGNAHNIDLYGRRLLALTRAGAGR